MTFNVDKHASRVQPSRPRHPSVALVLSFLLPGLGQIYNGQYLKAAFFTAIWFAAVLVVTLSSVVATLSGSLTVAVLLMGYLSYLSVDAWRCARRLGDAGRTGANPWYSYAVFSAAVIAASGFMASRIQERLESCFGTFTITSDSAAPMLLPGDRVLVEKLGCNLIHRQLERGDILLVASPGDSGRFVAGRIIAESGDTIVIRKGVLYRNGLRLVSGELVRVGAPSPPRGGPERTESFGPLRLPPGELLIMCTDRDRAFGGRVFDLVGGKAVEGRPRLIYWSQDVRTRTLRWQRIGELID